MTSPDDELIACPDCGAPMRAGRVELRSRLVTRVLADDHGTGVRLHFVAEAGGHERVIELGPVAYGCDDCDAVLLPGAGSDELACFECGTEIPADAEACPNCGWTW